MPFDMLPPRDQIAFVLAQIYAGGMTTTSGGNLSVREDDGDIWITPAATDKGSLTPEDVVCVRPDGTVVGHHRPSSELPFHRAMYQRRPDLKAIIHAHPPALVAFSIVRKIPDTRVIPQARHVCGCVGYAPYRLPGSAELGESIAQEFERGVNAVIMENHGTVVGAGSLAEAFQRFETLEFCAQTLLKAHEIGTPRILTEEQIRHFDEQDEHRLAELETVEHPASERHLRVEICKFVERACRQKLMISTYGTMAVRWRGNDFLVTPTDIDRRWLRPEDIVQVTGGKREPGKLPSRAVRLVQHLFESHPEMNCVILTQPPNAMAFAVSGRALDTHTIPESYLLLKDIPLVPHESPLRSDRVLTDLLCRETPIVLVENTAVLVTGASALEAFDRLEVAEFSARSLIASVPLGQMVPIEDKDIQDLQRHFFPEG